jgi:fumarate reductase subunit C
MKPLLPQPWPGHWFLRTVGYTRFMLRELTSVVLAGYLVFLLVFLDRVGHGRESYAALIERLRSPVSVVLHAIVLLAALFHAVTWFNLTPRIMPARIGEDRLPDAVVSFGGGYIPWILVSIAVIWAVAR